MDAHAFRAGIFVVETVRMLQHIISDLESLSHPTADDVDDLAAAREELDAIQFPVLNQPSMN